LVTAKDNGFKEGDLVIYVEIDSLLPSNNPNFSFMESRKFKVKTAKIRSTLSQGIIFPLSILEYNNVDINKVAYGDDVTEIIGITKFEKDDDLEESYEMTAVNKDKTQIYGRAGFPNFIKKTDEDRYQNNINKIKRLIEDGTSFEITEKLDGTSASYGMKRIKKKFLGITYKTTFQFYVCSRNLRISENDITSKYNVINRKYRIKEYMEKTIKELKLDTFVIQGEIVGQGIQKDKYRIGKDSKFYMFNMEMNGERLSLMHRTVIKDTFIPSLSNVPVVSGSHIFESIDEIAKMSERNSLICPSTIAEGIVIRTKDGHSYKAINPNFLLKNNE
jgi:RNA ligase (TIGR02306 family)